MFYQKLCKTTFVDVFEKNNFVFLRFFRILHIIVKKLNFGFSIVFTFSSWMRRYWFYVKNDFRNFHQIFTF